MNPTLMKRLAVLALVAFAGCATPPPAPQPKTTVVLLPDEDGNVGAVSVSSAGGVQKVDTAYASTTVQGTRGKPSELASVGQDNVDQAYGKLLKAQPPKPKSFVLNFVLNKTVLTEESKAQLPAVLEAVRERKPTEITIFGHTDSTGTPEYNQKLSADRARIVAELLRKRDPSLDKIDVQWFGDQVPLYPTDGKKAEPRNRRAEVMIL